MGTTTSQGVRALTEQDLDWLLPVDAGSFPEAWSRETWLDELNGRLSHYLLLLDETGSPVAYGGFWLVAGEAQIMRLAVDTGRRGEGWGNALVGAMLDRARELLATEVTLEVREHNLPARKTYAHWGFSENGRRAGYYTDSGEDAILMTCTLA